MPTLILNEKVGADGHLHLDVELPAEAREGEVEIVMTWRDPTQIAGANTDWNAFVDHFYGICADDPLAEVEDLPLQDDLEPLE